MSSISGRGHRRWRPQAPRLAGSAACSVAGVVARRQLGSAKHRGCVSGGCCLGCQHMACQQSVGNSPANTGVETSL